MDIFALSRFEWFLGPLREFLSTIGIGPGTFGWLVGIFAVFVVAAWRLLLPMRHLSKALRVAAANMSGLESTSLDEGLRHAIEKTQRRERRHLRSRTPEAVR